MNATSPGTSAPGHSGHGGGGEGSAGSGSARPRRGERRFVGIPISAGVAIGPVFYAREPEIPVTQAKIAAADIAGECARLEAAILQSRKQLNKLRSRLAVL